MKSSIAAAIMIATALPVAAQPVPDRRRPTKFEPVPRSMEQLLNDGYAIVGMGMGPLFTLTQRGRWVMCEVRPPGGLSGAETPQCECFALN